MKWPTIKHIQYTTHPKKTVFRRLRVSAQRALFVSVIAGALLPAGTLAQTMVIVNGDSVSVDWSFVEGMESSEIRSVFGSRVTLKDLPPPDNIAVYAGATAIGGSSGVPINPWCECPDEDRERFIESLSSQNPDFFHEKRARRQRSLQIQKLTPEIRTFDMPSFESPPGQLGNQGSSVQGYGTR